MKKNYFFILLFLLMSQTSFSQVGINTTTPDPSAVLDVFSTNKGLLLPRIANVAAITEPVADGLLIYDISSTCFRGYQNGSWSACLDGNASATTNGTAKVSVYTCSTASTGTLNEGVAVSGVTQTITAEVTQVGTYSISTSANGVTFFSQGTFASTGAQNVVLTAIGTPLVAGDHVFSLNTIPSCSFSRTTVEAIDASTNGTAKVSAYNCSTASAGKMTVGTAVSDVTQTITATVTKVGTYNISTTANGVTFAASGIFTVMGDQNIVLSATGTPTAVGSNTFTVDTTPDCSFNRISVAPIDASTNGTSKVAAYNCSAGSTGTLTKGVAVSGVTQTIKATVTAVGTYNISSVSNGVTFAASGTFTSTGDHNIVLAATGRPLVDGTSTFTVNTTPNCNFNRLIGAPLAPLPRNITLSDIPPFFIASINDRDYLPYVVPVGPAELPSGNLSEIADGTNEAKALNLQGTLTTAGITIKIPYTVLNTEVKLPAFSKIITIPAEYTEDNISRDLQFYYPAITLATGSGTIDATLQPIGGNLNVKKLDLQTGVGNDNLGILLAEFEYATNSAIKIAKFTVRAIAAIPDRNIANKDHIMFYMPVLGPDGNTWLNNNLGADYSNTAKSSFNPTQQAIDMHDWKAIGNTFQWGRYSDGHELVEWASGSKTHIGTPVNGTSSDISATDNPGHSLFILTNNISLDWRKKPYGQDVRWQGEAGANNPCPVGYRVPTKKEWDTLILLTDASSTTTRVLTLIPLKLVSTGIRSTEGIINPNNGALYWSSTGDQNVSYQMGLNKSFGSAFVKSLGRANGGLVRCIKD